MTDPRTRARDLMALAVGTPYSEEGRSAALAAVKLILREEMLSPDKVKPQGLGLVVAAESEAQRKEIEGLKREIERLRHERAAPPAPVIPVSMMLDIVSHLREIEALKREVARL